MKNDDMEQYRLSLILFGIITYYVTNNLNE